MSVTLAVAAVAAAGKAYSDHKASKDRKDEIRRMERAEGAQNAITAENRERILGLDLPSLTPKEIEQYSAQLNIEPELLHEIAQEQSSLASYEGDPRLQQNQMDALAQIAEVSEGGITEADKAAMSESQLESGRADRGRQEAILQSMARRGMAGSGGELAAKLSSAQGASDRAASDQRAMVQGAQQRALQAMSMRGGLAGDIRGQGFGEATAKARARDEINRFNANNSMAAQTYNVDVINAAQAEEARSAFNQKNANVDLQNSTRFEGADSAQRDFDNQLRKETAAAGQTPSLPTASSSLRSRDTAAKQKSTDQLVDLGSQAFGGAAKGGFGLTGDDEKDKKRKKDTMLTGAAGTMDA